MAHPWCEKETKDAPPEMNAGEACAWLRGYEEGFDQAMAYIAERDAGIDY